MAVELLSNDGKVHKQTLGCIGVVKTDNTSLLLQPNFLSYWDVGRVGIGLLTEDMIEVPKALSKNVLP